MDGKAGRQKKMRIVSEIDPVYDNKDWRLKLLRVWGYIRVSSDSRDQENSLKHQRAHYERFIAQFPNWQFGGIFSDDGISGTSVRNRTGFREMVEACEAGLVDLIVVKDVSRFARNVIDCLNTVQELLTLDPPVGIYFESHNLNTLDAGNKMFLTMFAMFAELESELKSKSVQFGLSELYASERYLCPAMNLLGYDKDGKYGLKIEPEGAKTVRLIYDLFLSGYSTKKIAAVLSDLKLPTATGKLAWSTAAVASICGNEKYAGAILMQKGFTINFLTHQIKRNTGQKRIYYETDHHEPIVSMDEFARALLLLEANHESPFFNHLYEVKAIRRGLLAGFMPMNPAFGGYDAGHYLAALVMAKIPPMSASAEVAHIAGTKRVRRELFSDKDAAILTLSEYGIQFSAGCVSLLRESAQVEVLLHPGEQLIAVRKAVPRNKNAVPWSTCAIWARELSQVIFELMGWRMDWKYRLAANYLTKNGEQVIFFDLNCCEYRFRNGERHERSKRAIPIEWLTEFGDGLPEQMLLCRRALADHLARWDIDAPAAAVESFGFKPISRGEASKRIEEMRARHE